MRLFRHYYYHLQRITFYSRSLSYISVTPVAYQQMKEQLFTTTMKDSVHDQNSPSVLKRSSDALKSPEPTTATSTDNDTKPTDKKQDSNVTDRNPYKRIKNSNNKTTSSAESSDANNMLTAHSLAKLVGGKPTFLTADQRSWIIHVPKFYPCPDDATFQKEWDLHPTRRHPLFVFGKQTFEKRWSQQWGISFTYSGNTNVAKPLNESPRVVELLQLVNKIVEPFCSNKNNNSVSSGNENKNKIGKDLDNTINTKVMDKRTNANSTNDDALQAESSTEQQPSEPTTASVLDVERNIEINESADATSDSITASTNFSPYNACLQNWYQPEDTIGLHADDEKGHVTSLPIWSLTWGGTRRFVLRPRSSSDKKVHEVYIKSGDLLIMGGTCQLTHKHEVPKVRSTKDPITSNRINWTIRAFKD